MFNIKIYFKNSILQFIISRYIIFIISFIRATSFAYILGPYFYGILGFVLLYRKYLSFANLGIPVSFNYFFSTNLNIDERNKYFTNSILAVLITTTIITLFIISLLFIKLNKEIVHFNSYIFLLSIFTILNNYSLLFNNLYRNLGKIKQVMQYQLLLELFIFPALLFTDKEKIIYAMLILMITNEVIYILISQKRNPFKFIIHYFDIRIIRAIISKGITILLFTSIVSLLFITTRTIIGYFFPIETMGVYTFSESLAIVAITAFDTIIWIVLPKLFYKLRKGVDNTEVMSVIRTIRSIYTPILFLVILLLIAIFPIFLFIFAEYKDSYLPFIFILIARGITSNGLGYSMLSVTRDIEYKAFFSGLIAISLNILISSLLIQYKYNFYFISFVMIPSAYIYTILIINIGVKSISVKRNLGEIMMDCLPIKILLPIILTIVVNSIGFYTLMMNIIILILFIILNLSNLKSSISKINQIIKSNTLLINNEELEKG